MGLTRVERVGAPDFITAFTSMWNPSRGPAGKWTGTALHRVRRTAMPQSPSPDLLCGVPRLFSGGRSSPQLSTVAAPEEIGGGRGFAVYTQRLK